MTRVLLFTGKGGVGKTTVAAATAVVAARSGRRVLVTSTDPAHSLADALDVPLGDEPVEVEPGLRAQQLDAQARLESRWGVVRDFVVHVLEIGGLDRVQAEELVLLPGLDELFALVELGAQVRSGQHDIVVVDCAPTAETLRLLALPDAVGWYADRLFGPGRSLAKALAPVARAVAGTVPLPDERVVRAVERLREELGEVHDLLRDRDCSSIRLVTTPERLALDETRRLATSLALFDHGVDAVVVNRVLPAGLEEPFLAGWHARHEQGVAEARRAFSPTPVLVSELAPDEPIGTDALAALGRACHGDRDPAAVLHVEPSTELEPADTGWLLHVPVPFADRDEVVLGRRGPDLHVRVGAAHRTVTLPARLRRCDVAGAAVRDGTLQVRFLEPRQVAAP